MLCLSRLLPRPASYLSTYLCLSNLKNKTPALWYENLLRQVPPKATVTAATEEWRGRWPTASTDEPEPEEDDEEEGVQRKAFWNLSKGFDAVATWLGGGCVVRSSHGVKNRYVSTCYNSYFWCQSGPKYKAHLVILWPCRGMITFYVTTDQTGVRLRRYTSTHCCCAVQPQCFTTLKYYRGGREYFRKPRLPQ